MVRKLPLVQGKVQEEMDKAVTDWAKDLNAQIGDLPYWSEMPKKGWSKEKVLSEIDKLMDLGRKNLTT